MLRLHSFYHRKGANQYQVLRISQKYQASGGFNERMEQETIFTTPRLTARRWRLEDAEAAFAVYDDDDVVRYLGAGRRPTNVEAQRESLRAIIERYRELAGYGSWALTRNGDGRILGAVLLKPLPNSTLIEVGWHLGRPHWGNGYATEAARGAIGYGFHELGLSEIYAIVSPENERSIAVTQRLGMEFLHVTDEFHQMKLNLYRITSTEGW